MDPIEISLMIIGTILLPTITAIVKIYSQLSKLEMAMVNTEKNVIKDESNLDFLEEVVEKLKERLNKTETRLDTKIDEKITQLILNQQDTQKSLALIDAKLISSLDALQTMVKLHEEAIKRHSNLLDAINIKK